MNLIGTDFGGSGMLAAANEMNLAPTWVFCVSAIWIALLVVMGAFLALDALPFFDNAWGVTMIGVSVSIAGWVFFFAKSDENVYPPSVDYWTLGFYIVTFVIAHIFFLKVDGKLERSK